MTQAGAAVMRGFVKLTPAEQREVQKEINDYFNSTMTKQLQLEEGMTKRAIDLGPMGSGKCPCCGK